MPERLKSDQSQLKDAALAGMTCAWLIALASTFGALFIGEVMGQMPCVTCWYQRIAMFPIVVVLGIGLLRGDENAWIYAMPLALTGAAIATWHSMLYAEILPKPIVPCTATGPSCTGAEQRLLDIIPIPYLSLTAFVLISALLVPRLPERLRSWIVAKSS